MLIKKTKVSMALAWAENCTNDKRSHANKEPFKGSCKKCKKGVWLYPVDNGRWDKLEKDGSKHVCATKEKKTGKTKYYEKDCLGCGKKIKIARIKDKWQAYQLTGGKHKCNNSLPKKSI